MLPQAPLCAVAREALPGVIQQMEARIEADVPWAARAMLWTSIYILMGLRFQPEATAELLRGVRDVKESSTYQAILEEGRSEGSVTEARRLLLLLGTARFGPPDEPTRAAIQGMNSIELLEPLSIRLLNVSSWNELLASS